MSAFLVQDKAVLRIRDVYPGSRFIFVHPDPGSLIPKLPKKERDKKSWLSHLFLTPQISQNLKIILFLHWWRKKSGPIYKELKNFSFKKLSKRSQKYRFGIRDPKKTYFGSRIQGSKRHRIPDLQHWDKAARTDQKSLANFPKKDALKNCNRHKQATHEMWKYFFMLPDHVSISGSR